MSKQIALTDLEKAAIRGIESAKWRYEFRAEKAANDAHCSVVYCCDELRAAVILIEEPSNTGASITNSIEDLADLLTAKLNLDRFAPDQVSWFEHYPARGYRRATLDRVRMQRIEGAWRAPIWQRVTRYKQKAES